MSHAPRAVIGSLRLAMALGFVIAAGCSTPSTAQLHIAGEPLLSLDEGAVFSATISRSPATSALSIAALTFEMDADVKSRFESLTITTDDTGLPALRGEPSCRFVHPGQDRAVVPMRITSAQKDASPAEFLVAIQNVVGAACAPRVTAWQSNDGCAAAPLDATAALIVEPKLVSQTICVRIESRDPEGEPLTLLTTTDLPQRVVTSALPTSATPFVDQTFAVELGNTLPLRGTFSLAHLLDGPGGTITVATTITIRAANVAGPQLGIEIREQPTSIAEFDVGTLSARVWRDPAPNEDGASQDDTCLLVELPQSPMFLPRAKPSLRWYDAATGRGNPASLDAPYLCGRDFLINVSPPFDSPAKLSVKLTATRCDCATGVALDGAVVESRTIAVDTASLADPLGCVATGGEGDAAAALACADLDLTGELTVVMARNGLSCAWSSTANRFTALPSAGALDSPLDMLALRIAGPTRNVIVGRFANAPFVRLASRNGASLTWKSAEGALGLGWPTGTTVDLQHAVGLSPLASATTPAVYLAAPAGTAIAFLNLDGGNDAPAPFVLPSSRPVLGLAAVDLGGTQSPDLVVFQPDATGLALEITVLEIDWPPSAPPAIVATHVVPPVSLANVDMVRGAVAQGIQCGAPAHLCQSLFFVAQTTDANARLLRLDPVDDWATLAEPTALLTPSAPITIAPVDSHLVAGLQFGIWELSHLAGGIPSWQARDPYIVEQSGTDAVVQPAPDYASALAPCLRRTGDVSAVAFAVTHAVARWTLVDDIRISTP